MVDLFLSEAEQLCEVVLWIPSEADVRLGVLRILVEPVLAPRLQQANVRPTDSGVDLTVKSGNPDNVPSSVIHPEIW